MRGCRVVGTRRLNMSSAFIGVTRFRLVADASSENSVAVRPLLEQLPGATVTQAERRLHVEAEMTGSSARELNRSVLTTLRRAERRTRMRAEWRSGNVAERFFDYVPKERVFCRTERDPTWPPF